jgi:hypothetical protein
MFRVVHQLGGQLAQLAVTVLALGGQQPSA